MTRPGFARKVIAVAISTFAFSSAYAANTTITNGGLTAIINDAGTFASFAGTEPSPTPSGTPGLTHGGLEYVNHGTPISWYWLEAGGSSVAALGSNPLGASTTSAGGGTVATTLSFGTLSLTQTIRAISPDRLQVQVSIFNSGSAAISGVKWGVGFDSDQGVSDGAGFATANTIMGQGAAAAVQATGLGSAGGTVQLRNDTSASAFTIAAYIDPFSCCTAVDPAVALAAGQLVGTSMIGDNSISLAYDLGTLAGGGTATIGYSYIFNPVPEPEIYAMMAAGLGLMGFVARRRKQQVV